MLYKPFLHYASPSLTGGRGDKRYDDCANAAIRVGRNTVRMGRLVRDQGLWVGQYWTILYAQFLATLVLLFCAVEQRDSQDSSDILLDAMMGRDNIANLANVSIAADRLLDTLNVWQYVLLKHLSLVVYVATNIWVVVSLGPRLR